MSENPQAVDQSNREAAHILAESWIERIYETFDGSDIVASFHDRHGIDSLLILTVASYYGAQAEVQKLIPSIEGKTVVEIGSGVGMLALQMARYASHVWAIEADPAWSWVFTNCLYAIKPPNLTWIFGRAQDMIGMIHADVAVVYTRSDVKGMGAIARHMAPVLIRGPLVSLEERYQEMMTPEQLAYAQEIATNAMLKLPGDSRRGLTGQQLREVEKAVLVKFPELAVYS